MDELSQSILACLDRVEAQRQLRAADAALAARVAGIKQWQHRRFAATYADFLQSPSTAPASRFFLDELYGPNDFSLRDEQFRRIVPGLAKYFPDEVAATVLGLARLHALSEELDSAMGATVRSAAPDAAEYARAWRSVGSQEQRDEQVQWMLDVGLRIDRLARKPLLRSSLVLMRGPATAAGFGALQRFLEAGLAAFRSLKEPRRFLETISSRERAIAAALYAQA